MTKWIIAAVIIVILGVGGWAVYNKNQSNTNASYRGGPNSTATSNTNTNSSGANSSQTSAGKTVNITNLMFTPSQITVKKGDTVTWTNNDSTAHTVVDDLSDVGGPSSGEIAPGASYSFTFTKTGSFQYHCSIHRSMRGTIVVQ